MSPRKQAHVKLSVFKGREAKLNKAIFHTLAHKAPQTAYDIYKELKRQPKLRHVQYATTNKRARALEASGYAKKVGTKETRVGFKAPTYELSTKAYLAVLLNFIDMDKLLKRIDEATAQTILTAVLNTHQLSNLEDTSNGVR